MIFIKTNGIDPAEITSFYQKAHFLHLDKVMTENRVTV